MKKIIIVLIYAVCILSLSGCGELGKEKVIDKYNQVVETVGDKVIHKDNELVGKREIGVDNYVGSYIAEYDNFTGQEILFGGTSIERDNGTRLKVKVETTSEAGKFSLSFAAGSEPVNVLIENEGKYEDELELANGSNYIYVDGESFSGNIQLTITDAN